MYRDNGYFGQKMDINSLAAVHRIKCRNARVDAERPNRTFTLVQVGDDGSVVLYGWEIFGFGKYFEGRANVTFFFYSA